MFSEYRLYKICSYPQEKEYIDRCVCLEAFRENVTAPPLQQRVTRLQHCTAAGKSPRTGRSGALHCQCGGDSQRGSRRNQQKEKES